MEIGIGIGTVIRGMGEREMQGEDFCLLGWKVRSLSLFKDEELRSLGRWILEDGL